MRWQPTADVATLRFRARALATLRAYFADSDALEVETPTLSTAGNTDPALASLSLRVQALGSTRCYLHTSPEFAMKRLLAAGSGDIYQICRVYRDAELGRWHEPEFTMLEWYRIGWDDQRLMDEVAEVINRILMLAREPLRVVRLSYRDAFSTYAGVESSAPEKVLAEALDAHAIAAPDNLDRGALLDLILSAVVVPSLPPAAIVLVHDYPGDQAALARINTTTGTAARFEAFVDGVELANGFAELTDATEQRRRFAAEHESRRNARLPVPPVDEALLAALDHGLPDCAGVAVGVDRLIAVASGSRDIASVMSFAHRRPE